MWSRHSDSRGAQASEGRTLLLSARTSSSSHQARAHRRPHSFSCPRGPLLAPPGSIAPSTLKASQSVYPDLAHGHSIVGRGLLGMASAQGRTGFEHLRRVHMLAAGLVPGKFDSRGLTRDRGHQHESTGTPAALHELCEWCSRAHKQQARTRTRVTARREEGTTW